MNPISPTPAQFRRQLMSCILHPSRLLMRHALSIHLPRGLYRGVSLVARTRDAATAPAMLNSSILFSYSCCCFSCRRCCITQNASIVIIAMPPTAAPIPIPAFAPSQRPVGNRDEESLVPVAVGTRVVAEATCLPKWARMLIALPECAIMSLLSC